MLVRLLGERAGFELGVERAAVGCVGFADAVVEEGGLVQEVGHCEGVDGVGEFDVVD